MQYITRSPIYWKGRVSEFLQRTNFLTKSYIMLFKPANIPHPADEQKPFNFSSLNTARESRWIPQAGMQVVGILAKH